jgi:hypothetical protein
VQKAEPDLGLGSVHVKDVEDWVILLGFVKNAVDPAFEEDEHWGAENAQEPLVELSTLDVVPVAEPSNVAIVTLPEPSNVVAQARYCWPSPPPRYPFYYRE